MPSPEQRRGGPPPEDQPAAEQESPPYARAARFRSEREAGRAYFRSQELIFNTDASLSAFRFQLNRVYHVAVVGDPPPEELDRRLQRLLSRGEPVTLPADLLRLLQERREQASQEGPWLERHVRPGQQV